MVANELRRDGQNVFDNDNFAVVLDTFRDRRNGVVFQTNPIGVIVDQQITDEGASFNRDWNTVWEVRTSRDAEGWSVEMALPFRSLRFPPGQAQVWGINFRRNLQARSEYAYLAPIPASAGRRGLARVSQAATLVGLEITKPVRQFELKPFAISSLTTDRETTPPRTNDLNASAGLDLKAGIGRGLTADLTIHTDFAQVEEDEAQVNLSRFSLFLPEKREFFLEGQGLFAFGGVPVSRGPGGGGPPVAPILFFSRRIGIADEEPVQILAGGRVTGKVGGWAVGALHIRQDDSEVVEDDGTVRPVHDTDFTVVRVRRDILRRSSVGLIYTRRSVTEDTGVANQAGGLDLLFAPTQDLTVNTYVAKSDTPGKRGDDLSYRARMDYSADRYGLQAEQLGVGTNFDPGVGLLRREDFQRSFVEGRFSPRPKSLPWLRKWNFTVALDYVTDNDRALESRSQQAGTRLELANGDEAGVSVQRLYEALDDVFELTEDHLIPAGSYTFQTWRGEYRLGPRHRITGEIGAGVGTFYDGTLREVNYRGRVEVTPAISLEPNVALNWIDRPDTDPFWINVIGLRATWALSPRAVASTLVQDLLGQRQHQREHPTALGIPSGQRPVPRLLGGPRHACPRHRPERAQRGGEDDAAAEVLTRAVASPKPGRGPASVGRSRTTGEVGGQEPVSRSGPPVARTPAPAFRGMLARGARPTAGTRGRRRGDGRPSPRAPMLRIGVDTGGTFTDLVLLDRPGLRVHKVRSTPDDPSRAILQGIRELLGACAGVVPATRGRRASTSSTAPRSPPTRCSSARAPASR